MPNVNNEKLVALNLERIKYWLGKGAHVTTPVAELFGKFLYCLRPKYIISWYTMLYRTNKQTQNCLLSQICATCLNDSDAYPVTQVGVCIVIHHSILTMM